MKVKEVNNTATVAWSPREVGAPHIVCATSAVHADSAAKNDVVQIYSLNLGEENLSMQLTGSINTTTRFHDIAWGTGGSDIEGNAGAVACAGHDGNIYVYNGHKLMTGNSKPLITSMEKQHAGPVLTLDFNAHKANLLASGSSNCEVFIWDINDSATPMSPGTKATLAADVTSVAWNRQVEHILASTYAGRCVVFDLRKSSSIIQISDAVSMVKASTVCWHPNVATQLALASSDDATPVVQIWDLRFASAPVRQCEGHQRGIQSLSWCQQDADMLCSAGKDNRVVCWSPSTGEVLCEFPAYNQWSYEVCWSPRDPALLATASVDGFVSVYSMMGGGYAPSRDVKFSAIADSFPGMDMPTEVPATVQPQHIYPRRPPAFMPSKAGCSFGFGGRLLSWHSGSRSVEISQVVTEPQLVEKSNQLLSALHNTQLNQYCAERLATAAKDQEKEVWQYINASLYGDATSAQYLALLGHPPPVPSPVQLSPQEEGNLAANIAALGTADGGSTGSLDPSEQFEMIASAHSREKTPDIELLERESSPCEAPRVLVSTEGGGGASIRKAVICGRLEEAVELCIGVNKYSLALVLAHHHTPDLYIKTRDRVLTLESDSDEVCGVVGAVVKADLDSVVVRSQLSHWKQAVVAVITHAPQQQQTPLLQRLGSRLESGNQLQAALVCYLIAGALDNFVLCWVKTKNPAASALSTQHLQELVEIILVVQQTGRTAVSGGGAGGAAEYLAQYASILATQGALTTALHYLANNAAAQTQGELMALKDRLAQALGHSSTAGKAATNRNRTLSTTSNSSLQHQAAYRKTSTPSVASIKASQFAPPVQQQPRHSSLPGAGNVFQPSVPEHQHQPPQQQFGFAPPPIQSQTCGGFQPPHAVPVPVATISATPPAATLTAPGGLRRPGGISRYVNSSTATPPPSASRPGMPTGQPAAGTASMTPFQPFQPFAPTNNITSAGSLAPQSSFLDPTATSNITAPPSVMPLAGGVGGGAFIPDAGQQQQNMPSKPPAAFDPSVKRGWNDPPPMSATRRAKQQQQQNSSPAEPINAMVPSQPSIAPPQQPFQGFQGFQPQGPPSGFAANQQQQQEQGGPVAPPPVAAPILPLSEDGQRLHAVLNGLYTTAMQAAPNLAMRQTFESVGPKLETLYNKLRSNQISSGTLQGLLSISQCIQSADYHSALQVHTQTVSAGNFAEMSSFMPAIKKLITTCMQCQIFIN